jgi:hypothetical protein
MMNHPDILWRYADTMTRQAEFDGHRCYRPPMISALATPGTTRRKLRLLGFR